MPRFRRPRQPKRRNMLRSLRWEFERRQGAMDQGHGIDVDDLPYCPDVDLVLDSSKPWRSVNPIVIPPPDPAADRERALQEVLRHFNELHAQVNMIEHVPGAILLGFTFAGEPCIAQISASRTGDRQSRAALPSARQQVLAEAAQARQIRVHVHFGVHEGYHFTHIHGLFEYFDSVRRNRAIWRPHMLGGIPAHTWLQRAGHVSEIGFRVVEDGWPYLLADSEPLHLPRVECWQRRNPPLDPCELCRSATRADECWIFTCECSVRDCGTIYRGVLVAHDEGLTVWRCPDQPDVPLFVFDQLQYRKAILALAKRLIRHAPAFSGLNWTAGVSPRELYRAMGRARMEWVL